MSRFFYDYDSTAKDADELYEDDEYEYGDEILAPDQDEWENSYHSIADELIED